MNEQALEPMRRWTRVKRLAAVGVAVGALGLGASPHKPLAAVAESSQLPAPPANGEMGFAIVQFHTPATPIDEKADCPDGMMGTLKDSYLRTLPAAQRERLTKPENANELDAAWKKYGVNETNGNVCGNIYEFLDRPPTPFLSGRVAWGFNLDDDESGAGKDGYTCKHDNFVSPTGERGVDNQYWRVYGCSQTNHGKDGAISESQKGFDGLMMTGEWTQVILLRGVDSLVNDPSVEVVYANTDDRPMTDLAGKPLHNASFSVATQGRKSDFRNVMHGRIVNGVLTTDPKHFVLGQFGGGVNTTFDLDRGRLRLIFQPDGTVKGMVGGYMPLLNGLNAPRGGSIGTVLNAGIDCAGQYRAIRMMADGARDPKTGQCTRISQTFELFGVPAFVNDSAPAMRTARK